MINDLPAQEEAALRRTYTELQKRHGEEVDTDLSQLAAASVFHNGMTAAKTQLESIKNAETTQEEAQSTANPKSWRHGMWSAAVRKDWQVLADAPYEIANDKELLRSAIASSQGRALKYASVELKADEELVLLATSFFGSAFADAAPELQSNPKFVLSAVRAHGAALAHASEPLRSDKSFLLEAAKDGSGSCLQGAKDSLKSDRDFVLDMVVHDAISARFASDDLRADKDFAIEVAKRNGAALKFLPPKFQADVDVVQAAVTRDPRAASLAHASRRHELGFQGEAALGETHLAKEYEAQAQAGQKLVGQGEEVVSTAELGPRHVPFPVAGGLAYTTMKLAKFVGFSAGSTMTGNLGQGNYVAANAVVDLLPSRNKPEIDSSTIMWGGVGGGIGMRWKSFASMDVLGFQEDSLLTIDDASKAVKFTCTKMNPPPLHMPSKFDAMTRQMFLSPTAGMIKLEMPEPESEGAKAAEVSSDWQRLAETRDREALKNLASVDRRPVPGNMPEKSAPLGGWPELLNGSYSKTKPTLQVGTRITLTGVRGKNGYAGSLSEKFGDGKWKVQIDGVGSAILHEENFEVADAQRPIEDQVTKDERTALRRAKILEKRSQLLEKKAAKNQALDKILASETPVRKRSYFISGTWNSWAAEEMGWNEDGQFYFSSVMVGETGQEAFQVLLDEQGSSCLHAGDVPQRCQGGFVVQGPDPKWRCEGFNFRMPKAAAGCKYSIRLSLDAKGFPKKVHWMSLE